MTNLREGRLCLRNEGQGKLCRLTMKRTSFKTAVKGFPNTLRVPSTDYFKSIASHKNCIVLKN